MTGQPDRRGADASDPEATTPVPAAPPNHETRDDLETTMTTQQPDETGTDETGPDETGPDPTLSASLGWPDATASAPQAPTPDTTALPVAHTTALPQAQTTALPQASGPAEPASQASVPAPAPFRVEPSAPVPDDVTPASDPDRLPPPVGEPVAQSYEGPMGPGVTVRRGPRPGTVMFGLLAVIVAAYVLVANLTNADVSIRLVGPPLVGAFGGMLLLVGIAGVLAGRLRR